MTDRITGYKIVRDDYTDCRSGTVQYEVGREAACPNPAPAEAGLCKAGLHIARTEQAGLASRGHHWPLRLLRVSAAPEDIIIEGDDKWRVRRLRVEEELPLAQAFGPQGQQVLEFIAALPGHPWLAPPAHDRARVEALIAEHLWRLEPYGAQPVPVQWVSSRAAARAAALDAARDAAWDAAGDAAWAAARGVGWGVARAAALDAAWDAAGDAAGDAAWAAAQGVVWAAAWAAARVAARGAAWLVVADRLSHPNPWEPLMEVWQMGYWPVGPVDGSFAVFEPEVVVLQKALEEGKS